MNQLLDLKKKKTDYSSLLNVKSDSYAGYNVDSNDKILNLKLVIV